MFCPSWIRYGSRIIQALLYLCAALENKTGRIQREGGLVAFGRFSSPEKSFQKLERRMDAVQAYTFTVPHLAGWVADGLVEFSH